MKIQNWLCSAAFAVVLSACGFDVTALSPQPNISLPSKHPGFELKLTPSVLDEYEIPAQTNIMAGKVHEWRKSLKMGFHNAFPAEPKDDRLVLVLERVSFSMVPAAVASNGMVVSGRGQIEYRGRWQHGENEAPFSGRVVSKQTSTSSGEVNLLASSAIEAMYEELWQALASAK